MHCSEFGLAFTGYEMVIFDDSTANCCKHMTSIFVVSTGDCFEFIYMIKGREFHPWNCPNSCGIWGKRKPHSVDGLEGDTLIIVTKSLD